MSTLLKRKVLPQVSEFFGNSIVRHSIIWVLLYAVLVLLSTNEYGLGYTLARELINVLMYVVVVYFNLNYLIPNYLTQKSFATYCGLLLATVIVLTPIKTLLFYFLFTNSPDKQEYVVFHQQYIFLSTFMIAGASTIIKIMTDWLKHQREKKELQTQTMQSELRFLKSQINPHFLFNTLNSLYALTLKKSDKAPEIVIKLSEIMRYMLYECNERRVPLRKEVNYLKNYLDLEKLRQGDDVDIKFNIS